MFAQRSNPSVEGCPSALRVASTTKHPRAHPRGAHAGPGSHPGADRLAHRAHPPIRPQAGGDLQGELSRNGSVETGRGDRAAQRAHVRANPRGPPPLRKEPLGRGVPGARSSHRPIGGQRSAEAHLQGGRPDAKEAPGLKRPLHPRSFWLGLGPTTSWRKDRLSGRQELKEASGGGRSKEALGAFAPPVGDRRDLRSTLQHSSAPKAAAAAAAAAAGGSLKRAEGAKIEAEEEVKITGQAAGR